MLTDSSFNGSNPTPDIEPPPSVHVVRSDETIRRGRGVSIMGLAVSLAGLGLAAQSGATQFNRFGHVVKKVARKVHVNPQRETTVYRSRGHGNQHTPPNYPKTRRKRKTRRERGEDRFAAKCSADGWDGYFKREIAAQ